MIERIMCALFGHKYVVEKRLSSTSRKVGCTICNKKWAMNDDVRAFVPWDYDFEKLYEDIASCKQPTGEIK
jgi:hypothetical protein